MRIQQKQLPTHSSATTAANVALGILLVGFLLGILGTIASFSFQGEEEVGETMSALTLQPLQTISTPLNHEEGNLLLSSAGTKTVVLVPRDRVTPNHSSSQEQPQLKSTEEAHPSTRGMASVKVENASLKGKHNDGWSYWHYTVIGICALISLGWSMVVANRVIDRWIAEDGDDDLPENDNENFKRSIMDGVGSEVSQLGYQSCSSSGWSGLPFDKFDL